ncbi:DnaJ domain-containing protein [Spirosoma endophyticum]|uniref:DnaJ domain-containing protein n=1 Tax=Spirosoma endophyticum TaxID=662367 RepID=UPI000B882E08
MLGVTPTARWEDIRTAYQEKVKVCNPDKGGSEQAFAILQSAYEMAKKEYSVP